MRNKKLCKSDGCKTQPSYNYKGERNSIFCFIHKLDSMVNVRSKLCEKEGCKIQPNFNYKGETKGRFCNMHKEDNMINVKDRMCEKEGCNKRPNFNYKGENSGRFCSSHKEDNMINVKDRMCQKEECKIQPSFNYKGETKGLFCRFHKQKGMVDIKSKKCKIDGCNNCPSYNYEGETKGLFCNMHKEDNMVNVKHKKCEEKYCVVIPSFNYKGETKGRFCNNHKEDNMVDVIHKNCEKEGCKTQPIYNYEGETKGRFCIIHKEDNMVDVKHKKCIIQGCKIRSHFGYCGYSPSHCNQHKLYYMINKPIRKCIGSEDGECKDIAIYGKDEPLHCEEHSQKDEICWLVKRCSHCGRGNELLNKFELCSICCDNPFYEEGKILNKIKESIMVKYLRNNFKGNEILADRIIDKTCNLYRPDILYDCGTHIIVVECDEKQHKNYPWEICSLNRSLEHMEEKRMYEIMVAYGLPTIFLRWNPDSFNVGGIINKKYTNEKRLHILVKCLEVCMKMKVEEGVVKYKKLFYDEYDEGDGNFKKINEKELL